MVTRLHPLAVAAFRWSIGVQAQTLTIPKSWTDATLSLDRQSRELIANRAAAALLQEVNPTSYTASGLPRVQDYTSIYAVLALQDYYSGNTSWRDTVVNGIQAWNAQYGLYDPSSAINSDAIYWGITFFHAYRTYRQQPLLDLAIAAYNATYSAGFITTQNADSGSGSGRSTSFPPSPGCTNSTLAGGVFVDKDDQSRLDINMETVGPFMTLAAHLYELTNDPAYQQAAQLTFDFTLNHMYDAAVGIMVDTFDLSKCQLNLKPLTINQAWFIEGLSIWANITNNNTLTSFLEGFVLNVTTYPSWASQDGVISEAPQLSNADAVLKGIFIRGLVEARMRNPKTNLERYIDAYIAVQFNSVLTLSRSPPPNDSFYTTSWSGPPVTSFSAAGNIVTLDVLNAAFSITPPLTPSNTTTHSPTATSAYGSSGIQPVDNTRRSSSKAGTIAGGVIGAVAALMILACASRLWRNCQRNRGNVNQERGLFNGTSSNMRNAAAIEPFVLPSSSPFAGTVQSSKWHRSSTLPRGENAPSTTYPLQSPALDSVPREGSRAQGDSNGSAQSNVLPAGELLTAHSAPGASVDQIDVAEIPVLVGLLNNLLQDRQSQLPPRYEA